MNDGFREILGEIFGGIGFVGLLVGLIILAIRERRKKKGR
jgi:hypothetical protein